MSHDGVGAEATIVRDSREGVAEGQVEEIRANAVGSSGGDVQDGEERTDASRSGGATGGGRRILPRGNDSLVETPRSADSNRLRVLGISEEQWIERCLHIFEVEFCLALKELGNRNCTPFNPRAASGLNLDPVAVRTGIDQDGMRWVRCFKAGSGHQQ